MLIGPGARIVGPVRIGRGATIGPNAVVTQVSLRMTRSSWKNDARIGATVVNV